LAKHNFIKDSNQFWGNSAGALMATCLSLNTSLPTIRKIFYDMDFTKFRDFDLTNIMSFSSRWGLDSGDAFNSTIKGILDQIKPGASQYTLQEIPGLHITASDLTVNKPIIMDASTYPTMKLVDALRASTSIPFFYVPVRNPVNNHLLVDGAISCNFPWALLPKEIRDDAIGFDFCTNEKDREPVSLAEYIPAIMNFRDKYWRKDQLKKNNEPNVMVLKIKGFPTWHLALTKEDRDELVRIGESTALDWVNSRLDSKTAQAPAPCAVQHTPAQASPSGHISGSLGIHGYPSPLQHRGRSLHSLTQSSLTSRRWSL
jgi:predicted acylesterase/phospholipase RssA